MKAWYEKSQSNFAKCTKELNASISWLGEAFEDIENFVAGHMILTAGVFICMKIEFVENSILVYSNKVVLLFMTWISNVWPCNSSWFSMSISITCKIVGFGYSQINLQSVGKCPIHISPEIFSQ